MKARLLKKLKQTARFLIKAWVELEVKTFRIETNHNLAFLVNLVLIM